MKINVEWQAVNKQKDEFVTSTGYALGLIFYNRMVYHENTYDASITGTSSEASFPDKPSAKTWVEQQLGVEMEEQGQAVRIIQEVADISGDGGYQYDVPSNWVEGFSSVLAVEYPAGKQVPVILEPGDYSVYKSPSGLKLHFYALTPVTGETIRITYTAKEGQTDGH